VTSAADGRGGQSGWYPQQRFGARRLDQINVSDLIELRRDLKRRSATGS
jgi:hypothetical protein